MRLIGVRHDHMQMLLVLILLSQSNTCVIESTNNPSKSLSTYLALDQAENPSYNEAYLPIQITPATKESQRTL